ncbi:hypothetical protein PoB_000230300 [Plakobranchus ocellatus]|uniref:Uncharacterized protein n=1 Tax=Plakobranchus ocellatus TaxID=259542 RepID=A0AAV3XZJ6_9GAST|nr:hypothetical protein PoB_000230300 [Plakobranchus ocellatus]
MINTHRKAFLQQSSQKRVKDRVCGEGRYAIMIFRICSRPYSSSMRGNKTLKSIFVITFRFTKLNATITHSTSECKKPEKEAVDENGDSRRHVTVQRSGQAGAELS